MPALKSGWLLLLAGAVACDGPTLWVGALRDAELEVVDAGPSVDAGMTVRDAQAREGGGGFVIIKCFGNEDCPRELPRCHSDIHTCTQCEIERDCKQNEWCDYWACRSKDDDDRGPGGPTASAP